MLSAFLLTSISASAIPPRHSFYYDNNSTAPEGWIFNIWAVNSYSHYKSQPGNLRISFPYTLTSPVSPVAVNRVFSSETNDLIKQGKLANFALGLEVGKENFSVEAHMGLYFHHWSDNLYGGINYRFILKKIHASPEKLTLASMTLPGKRAMRNAATFPVKLSLGIYYFQPLWKLGAIDLGNNEFNALGYTMQSLDSNTSRNSGNVTVFFHQNIVALKPAISIGYEPENLRLIFNFTASPMIILSEIGGLRFYMNNTGVVDWVPRNGIDPAAVIPLNTFGLDATFNGEKVTSTPFHLKATMYTFKVGFRIVK
ncbi:MAG: hypothetical protein M3R17_03795 [Bacteroidota bacterium]|nr:hypothetical protein [Bacteroidota bacterium]